MTPVFFHLHSIYLYSINKNIKQVWFKAKWFLSSCIQTKPPSLADIGYGLFLFRLCKAKGKKEAHGTNWIGTAIKMLLVFVSSLLPAASVWGCEASASWKIQPASTMKLRRDKRKKKKQTQNRSIFDGLLWFWDRCRRWIWSALQIGLLRQLKRIILNWQAIGSCSFIH